MDDDLLSTSEVRSRKAHFGWGAISHKYPSAREIRDPGGGFEGRIPNSLATHNRRRAESREPTQEPMRKRRVLRQISGGELQGY